MGDFGAAERLSRSRVPCEADGYIRECHDPDCHFPKTITVPAGEYYVLGDNRGASDDSRFWGPVPRAWIIGTVVG